MPVTTPRATISESSSHPTPSAPLGPGQCDGYRKHGYLVLRQLLPVEQISRAAAEAEVLLRRTELMHTDNLRCRWTTDAKTGNCIFETFDPIADLSPACGQIATDPRILAAIGMLYGEEACLFKDKLIFKPAGAKGYGLHQDYIAWPSFPRSFLTAVIPLDSATEENGCTEVYSGYHTTGAMSPEDGEYHELSIDAVDPSRAVKLVLNMGDVAVFSGFTPHRSAPNLSKGYRRQLYLSYNALSDGGHQRERHYQEFLAWLRIKYAEHGRTGVYFR